MNWWCNVGNWQVSDSCRRTQNPNAESPAVPTSGLPRATVGTERLRASQSAPHLCQSLTGELEFALALYSLQNSVPFTVCDCRIAPLLELLAQYLSSAVYSRFHSSDRDSQDAGCLSYRELVEVAILERDPYSRP